MMKSDRRSAEWSQWLGVLTVFAGLLVTTAATASNSPKEYIQKHAQEVTDLLAQGESPQRADKFSKKAQNLIDFRTLASRALEGHWEKRSDAEQKQFLDLLQQLLEANYKKKLEGYELGEDYEIKYLEEKQRGGRSLVRTKVIWGDSEKERKPVEYKLMKKDGDWVVYDVVIDGASLEETYREAYTEIIREDGWNALIEKMKEKIEKLRAKAD